MNIHAPIRPATGTDRWPARRGSTRPLGIDLGLLPPTSGQARVNFKRLARAAFWAEERRTVRVFAGVEEEQFLRANLHLLGPGTRIQASSPLDWAYATEFHIHIPGAPAAAERAVLIFRNRMVGRALAARYEPILVGIEWYGTAGYLNFTDRTTPQPAPTDTGPACWRCNDPAAVRDDLDAPFCAPCAEIVTETSPDVLPMRPIEEADRG